MTGEEKKKAIDALKISASVMAQTPEEFNDYIQTINQIIDYLEQEGEKEMTWGDIYNEFCKKFPDADVEDYRPAVEVYIPQLAKGIPNAIIVWLKDGSKVIYIAKSEGETNGGNSI